MSIFLKNAPGDPRNIREAGAKVKSTGNPMMDAMLEDLGGTKENICVASGRTIKERDVTVRCKTCKVSSLVLLLSLYFLLFLLSHLRASSSFPFPLSCSSFVI